MTEPRLIEKTGLEESLARTRPPGREPFRIAAVQEPWHAGPDEHREAPAAGIRLAAARGARLVAPQELTLSPYFAWLDLFPFLTTRRPEAYASLVAGRAEDK